MSVRKFLAVFIVLLCFPAGSTEAESWSEGTSTPTQSTEFEKLAKELNTALRNNDEVRALELFHLIRQHEHPMAQLLMHQGAISDYLEQAFQYTQEPGDKTNIIQAKQMIELVTLLLDEDMRLARRESVDPVFPSNWESGPIWRLLLLHDQKGLIRELKYLEKNNLKPKANMTFLWAYQYGSSELVPVLLDYGLSPILSEIYVLAERGQIGALKHLMPLLSETQMKSLITADYSRKKIDLVLLLATAAGDLEFMTFLLNAGLDPNFVHRETNSLKLAQKTNNEEAIRLLRSYGAK